MKKLFVFFLVMVMLLSITVVSFAAINRITKGADSNSYILGTWLYKENEDNYILCIGFNETRDMYVAQLTICSVSDKYIKELSTSEYSITPDWGNSKEYTTYYLTNDADSVSYRMEYETDNIRLIKLPGTAITFDRIK